MFIEPITAAKSLNILKNLPLSFLISITLALYCFLWFPRFSDLVSAENKNWIIFSAILFSLMTLCRILSGAISFLMKKKQGKSVRRLFHLTPVDTHSYWHLAKQKDDSINTQIHIDFTAKNMTDDKTVHLLKVRLAKPKISGAVINDMILLRAPDINIYGTAHTSGHYIPPGCILPGSINLMIQGVPKKSTGMLKAAVIVQDADGNEQTIKVSLKHV